MSLVLQYPFGKQTRIQKVIDQLLFLKFMHYVYIIFSDSSQKFYVGETVDITERLLKHNSGAYSNAFTSQANDWTIQTTIECENRTIAMRIESHIKSLKSRVYLENLVKYPELREKLAKRFHK